MYSIQGKFENFREMELLAPPDHTHLAMLRLAGQCGMTEFD